MDVFHHSGYRLSLYALLPFVTSAATALLAWQVWRTKRGALATGPFVVMTIPFALWLAAQGAILTATNEATAIFWSKVVFVAICFIPPTVYYFWTALLRVTQGRRILLTSFWTIAAGFAVAGLTTETVVTGVYHYRWGYYPRYEGPLAHPFLVYMFGSFVIGLGDLWRARRRMRPQRRARVPAFLTAFGIAALATVDFLPAFGVPVYPIGSIFVLGFVALTARAIRSYGLVDITPIHAARQVFDTMVEALFVCDEEGRVRLVNPAACGLFGVPESMLLGRSFEDFIDRETPQSEERLRRLLNRETGADREHVLVGPDGLRVHCSLAVNPLQPTGAGRAFILMARDITAVKQAEQQLTFHAYHDPSTGLPNLSLLRAKLAVALSHAEREKRAVAVLAVGLDQFELVNDSLGRANADRFVQMIAQRLSGRLRQSDVVTRTTDGSFGILISDLTEVAPVIALAHKLLRSVSEPVSLDGTELRPTVAIGLATYPAVGSDADTLIQAAERAMRHAQKEGRNRVQIFTAEMNLQAAERLTLESSLHLALDRDEFVLHFQPIIHAGRGETVAAEALIRWKHPQRGLVYPADFIPVAERSSVIVPLGRWVLRAACQEAVRWRSDGFRDMRVAVNVSLKQLTERRFASYVSHVLEETGLPSTALEIEITESTAAADVQLTASLLHALREMGVRITIDDFGTGYSSLAYLKKFPVSAIKIDRSFLRDVPGD
ncbi:MAG TPA: EAL domain-containing protein, partial [Thermoanaerobaculia bacterium]